MEQKKINREYKDTVFRKLFSTKENALSLYNAINGTNYGEQDEFKLETLDNAFFADKYNDLAFSINGRLVVFCEEQSSRNPNMPFRMLCYMVRTYERMYNERIFFSSGQRKLITPEFYLVYNGVEAWNVDELRLSDAFLEKPAENSAELVVKVLNLRYNLYEKDARAVTAEEQKVLEVLTQSAVMKGYYLLSTYTLDGLREGLTRAEAVNAAINRCIEEGYLVEFLQAEKREVSSMMFDWISTEEYRKIIAEDMKEQAEEQAKAQLEVQLEAQLKERLKEQEMQLKGQLEAQLKTQMQEQLKTQMQAQMQEQLEEQMKKQKDAQIASVQQMKADGLPTETIMRYSSLSREEIEAIE